MKYGTFQEKERAEEVEPFSSSRWYHTFQTVALASAAGGVSVASLC